MPERGIDGVDEAKSELAAEVPSRRSPRCERRRGDLETAHIGRAAGYRLLLGRHAVCALVRACMTTA